MFFFVFYWCLLKTKKFWILVILTRKKLGPTKYPQEKLRTNEDTMAQWHETYETHDGTRHTEFRTFCKRLTFASFQFKSGKMVNLINLIWKKRGDLQSKCKNSPIYMTELIRAGRNNSEEKRMAWVGKSLRLWLRYLN